MKCKFCGHDISDTDTLCPGCDKDVKELKNGGFIIYEENNIEPIIDDNDGVMVGEAKDLKDLMEEDVTEAFEPIKETFDDTSELEGETNTTVEETKDKSTSVEPIVIKEKFKKKNGLKAFLIILVLILLLAAGGFGYMYFIYTSPSKIVKKVYNALIDIPDATTNTIELNYTDSKLSDYNFNSVNYINDAITSNITISGTDNMLNVDMYKNGNEVYVLGSDISSNYVKFDEGLISNYDYFKVLNMIVNRNEFKKIINNFNLSKLIDDNEYKKEYTTTTYEQKNMAATKVSYNNSSANSIVEKVLLAIRDNKTNLTSVSKLFNKTEDDIKLDINNRISDINTDNYKMSIELYTDYLVNTYYKMDITITSNMHNYVASILFTNNKEFTIKITIDEKYITIDNNMTYINITNGDDVTTYNYKYINKKLDTPVLDEYLVYDDVKETIDTNVANNIALQEIVNIIKGEPLPLDTEITNPDDNVEDTNALDNSVVTDTDATADTNTPETNEEE